MKSSFLLFGIAAALLGCRGDDPSHSLPDDIPAAVESSEFHHLDNPIATGDGVELFQQCLTAMGGKEGFAAMKSGYIRLTTDIRAMQLMQPDVPQKTMILSIHYDASGRERRHVRSTDGEFDTLFISNGRKIWIQPKHGEGKLRSCDFRLYFSISARPDRRQPHADISGCFVSPSAPPNQ